MLNQLTKLGTVSLTALLLGLLGLWLIAGETIRAAAPWVIYTWASILIMTSLVWLGFFTWRQFHTTQAYRAEAHMRKIEAAAAAGLAEARAHAEARKLTAEARQAERAADLHVITAAAGEQVFISDNNQAGRFIAAHLALSGQLNGKPIDPTPIQVAAWERWHTARTSQPTPQLAEQSQSSTPISLPEKIDLHSLIPTDGPSLNKITLGVTTADTGLITLDAPLSQMVHIGVGGSSGWGKSVLIQSLAYQIALSPEAAQLALIDIEAQTFSPFSHLPAERLRYPLADDETDIIAILDDLQGEWYRRREKFQAYPTAQDLADYNRLADNPLPYVVLMIDEVNMLSGNKEIVSRLVRLGQGTRKYGLFCCLGGQNWNADDIPTKLRNNFSTRIQLKAMSKTQSRIMLEDSAAAAITQPGRAWAVLPGRPLCEVQTPFVDKETLAASLIGLAAMGARPKIKPVEQMICEMYQNGASLNVCYRRLYEVRQGKSLSYKPNKRNREEIKGLVTAHNITLRPEDSG